MLRKPFPRVLCILCDGGLANRMHAIAGAYVLAKQLKRRLKVYWPINDCCGAAFEALFQPTPEFDLMHMDDATDMLNTSYRTKFYNCGTVYGPDGVVTSVSEFENINPYDPHEVVCIKSWYVPRIKDDYAIRDMAPVILALRNLFVYGESLKAAMRPLAAGMAASVKPNAYPIVGVHVRYGDKLPDGSWDLATLTQYSKSPFHEFVAAMNHVKDLCPNVLFKVASTNEDVKEELARLFGDCVFVFPKSDGRACFRGMLHDAAEMFLLGLDSQLIIGSDWSQYSQIPSEFYSVPLVIAGSKQCEKQLTSICEKIT